MSMNLGRETYNITYLSSTLQLVTRLDYLVNVLKSQERELVFPDNMEGWNKTAEEWMMAAAQDTSRCRSRPGPPASGEDLRPRRRQRRGRGRE